MTSISKKARLVSVVLLGAILLSLAVMPMSGASGAATCPISMRVKGSTTVGPISDAAKPLFEALYTGTTQVNSDPWEGSGTGISSIRAGTTNVGMSSRDLTPAEYPGLYVYRIAKDAMVIGVRNSGNMSFINNITSTQVKSIWESGYVGATWDDYGLGGPATQIVMRSRITTSGSFTDFNAEFAVNAGLEANTINASGLPRLQESLDMAQAAAGTDYTVAYTSLANLDVPNLKALTLDGIAPSQASVINGTYPKTRRLYLLTRENAATGTGTLRIDDSSTVLGDDYINFIYTTQGQTLIQNLGFVAIGAASGDPIPSWDINMDGSTSLGDLGAITAKWGQSASGGCEGWIRADANDSGNVSLGDIGVVTGKWGNPGFAAPVYP